MSEFSQESEGQPEGEVQEPQDDPDQNAVEEESEKQNLDALKPESSEPAPVEVSPRDEDQPKPYHHGEGTPATGSEG